MERPESDPNPFPNKLVKWRDIAMGVGIVVAHALFDHIKNPSPSEHFQHSTDRPATIPQNYDSEGREVL